MSGPSREVPIDPAHAALLIIDVQNYCAPSGSGGTEYFRDSLRDIVLPNIRRLQSTCRQAGVEVVYSVIENMTRDGRDRSLDYKISGIDVPRGAWEARVLDEIAPAGDEMVFRKISSNVFVSTGGSCKKSGMFRESRMSTTTYNSFWTVQRVCDGWSPSEDHCRRHLGVRLSIPCRVRLQQGREIAVARVENPGLGDEAQQLIEGERNDGEHQMTHDFGVAARAPFGHRTRL